MKLIVGLGNPGEKYQATRHNIGFRVIDALAALEGVIFQDAARYDAQVAGLARREKVLLIKPQTYMNLSGKAVKLISEYYKVEPRDIWVVSDDLDLTVGRIRIRDTGASGGHKGLQSIIEALGTENFYRYRVGIAPLKTGVTVTGGAYDQPEASVFVLQPFDKREAPVIEHVVKKVVSLIQTDLEAGVPTCHTLEAP